MKILDLDDDSDNDLFLDEDIYKSWEDNYLAASDEQLWGNTPSPVLELFLRKANVSESSIIADYGSGDGRNTIPLLRRGYNLVCIDISRTALRRIAEAISERNLKKPLLLLYAPLESLPLLDEQFDFGICIDTLLQLRHPRRALEEIHRTLRNGALLFINLFTPADCSYGEGEMVGAKTFLYRNTLFSFYDIEDCRRLFRGIFTIVQEDFRNWVDPPHYPFRPYEHQHSALVYILTKI